MQPMIICRCGGTATKVARLRLYECDTCGRVDTLHELRAQRPRRPPAPRREFEVSLPGPYPRVTWSGA